MCPSGGLSPTAEVKKKAADIVALISASQTNTIKAFDIFEEMRNEEACAGMNTIYYINSLAMAFLIREYSLTPEDLSNSLHDMILDVGANKGKERAKVFMESIQETVRIIQKNISDVSEILSGDIIKGSKMDVAKKVIVPRDEDRYEEVDM